MTIDKNPYLHFEDITPSERKTRIVGVYSTSSGDLLGLIRWFGRWRQYCFYPCEATIWNPTCLDSVNLEIRAMMEERRKR